MDLHSSTRGLWLRLALLALVLTGLGVAGRWIVPELLPVLGEGANIDPQAGLRWAGIAGFIGLYVAAVVALLPGSILAIAAGVAFGTKLGLVVAVVASNLGAQLSFLLARGIGREPVKRLLRDRLPLLETGASELGFETILGLRLLSVVPLVNYASGLSAVRYRDFALASLLGMLPSTLAFVVLGSNFDPRAPEFWLAVGMALALAGLPIVWRRRARRNRARLLT